MRLRRRRQRECAPLELTSAEKARLGGRVEENWDARGSVHYGDLLWSMVPVRAQANFIARARAGAGLASPLAHLTRLFGETWLRLPASKKLALFEDCSLRPERYASILSFVRGSVGAASWKVTSSLARRQMIYDVKCGRLDQFMPVLAYNVSGDAVIDSLSDATTPRLAVAHREPELTPLPERIADSRYHRSEYAPSLLRTADVPASRQEYDAVAPAYNRAMHARPPPSPPRSASAVPRTAPTTTVPTLPGTEVSVLIYRNVSKVQLATWGSPDWHDPHARSVGVIPPLVEIRVDYVIKQPSFDFLRIQGGREAWIPDRNPATGEPWMMLVGSYASMRVKNVARAFVAVRAEPHFASPTIVGDYIGPGEVVTVEETSTKPHECLGRLIRIMALVGRPGFIFDRVPASGKELFCRVGGTNMPLSSISSSSKEQSGYGSRDPIATKEGMYDAFIAQQRGQMRAADFAARNAAWGQVPLSRGAAYGARNARFSDDLSRPPPAAAVQPRSSSPRRQRVRSPTRELPPEDAAETQSVALLSQSAAIERKKRKLLERHREKFTQRRRQQSAQTLQVAIRARAATQKVSAMRSAVRATQKRRQRRASQQDALKHPTTAVSPRRRRRASSLLLRKERAAARAAEQEVVSTESTAARLVREAAEARAASTSASTSARAAHTRLMDVVAQDAAAQRDDDAEQKRAAQRLARKLARDERENAEAVVEAAAKAAAEVIRAATAKAATKEEQAATAKAATKEEQEKSDSAALAAEEERTARKATKLADARRLVQAVPESIANLKFVRIDKELREQGRRWVRNVSGVVLSVVEKPNPRSKVANGVIEVGELFAIKHGQVWLNSALQVKSHLLYVQLADLRGWILAACGGVTLVAPVDDESVHLNYLHDLIALQKAASAVEARNSALQHEIDELEKRDPQPVSKWKVLDKDVHVRKYPELPGEKTGVVIEAGTVVEVKYVDEWKEFEGSDGSPIKVYFCQLASGEGWLVDRTLFSEEKLLEEEALSPTPPRTPPRTPPSE